MRSVYRVVWLWLASMMFNLPWVLAQPDHAGATLGWSPIADVNAVEQTASWDLSGWYQDGQDELHDALNTIEMQLWLGLVEVRETAYQWRDGETQAQLWLGLVEVRETAYQWRDSGETETVYVCQVRRGAERS